MARPATNIPIIPRFPPCGGGVGRLVICIAAMGQRSWNQWVSLADHEWRLRAELHHSPARKGNTAPQDQAAVVVEASAEHAGAQQIQNYPQDKGPLACGGGNGPLQSQRHRQRKSSEG